MHTAMQMTISEDISRERLTWLVEQFDELFLDIDENENET